MATGEKPSEVGTRRAVPDVSPATIARISRRIVPFFLLLYVVNFLDRVNVGFAALQMNRDLGFGPEVYGFGAGIFFLGYVLFEIPSNLVLRRVGSRVWLSRIMITWGLIAMAAAFTNGRNSFYVLRLLLGVAEAGFVPGMIYYLADWFPARERARVIAKIWSATAIAIVVGSPISGLISQLDGILGLPAWRWIFLLEGLPALVMGFVSFFFLSDEPTGAAWLAPEERAALSAQIAREHEASDAHGLSGFKQALSSGRVWALAILYFCIGIGFFGITLWLPQIVKQLSGLGTTEVSLITTIPFLLAAGAMILNARHSDRTGERRWHLACPLLVGAFGLAGSGLSSSPIMALVSLCIAAMGMWSSIGVFWSVPTAFLRGTAAAGGLALINSIGGLGGFVGPYLIGLVRSITPDFSVALLGLSVSVCLAALLAAVLPQTSSAR